MSLYQKQASSPEMLYPQAQDTLTAFRKTGVKIGLCTNKFYDPTIQLLQDIGIGHLFNFVAGGDSFSVCKPHRDHVLGVAMGLSLSPKSCVMIGDSSNDIKAARGANIRSIAVRHGYCTNIDELGADTVIANFGELPRALRHLGFDLIS